MNWGRMLLSMPRKKTPLKRVQRLTDGNGADLVIDCVGGHAGVKSFEQAQDMVRRKGTIQLIALYQGGPLPLHSSKIMSKRLVAGILTDEPRGQIAQRAIEKIRAEEIQAAQMISRSFPYQNAEGGFRLLVGASGRSTCRSANLAVESRSRANERMNNRTYVAVKTLPTACACIPILRGGGIEGGCGRGILPRYAR